MRLRLLAFATASDVLGTEEVAIEVGDGLDVSGLRTELARRYPALQPLWPRLAIGVDGVIADAETPLREGSEVALLPPVSGG
jgi:molybdopterin converting factor small subunit